MRTSSINIRVDEKLKNNAVDILNTLGLSLTDAIRIYLSQIILHDGIPFDVKIQNYNKDTIKAIENVNNEKNLSKTFLSINDLMEDLNADN